MIKESTKAGLIKIFSYVLCIIYIVLSIYYAHHLDTVMDEGTYLIKGKLFLEGKYRPFAENGLLTNKPPFSFWILGLSQIIKVGLRSGRYFAVLLNLGIFMGVWLTSKKYFSEKSAFFNILLLTTNQAIIIYYSRAMTEVVTALLIIWSLYFLLGAKHNKTELSIGLILAALIPLTRQNLLPFYIFSIIYVLWENRLNKAIMPVLLSITFFVGFHIYYWPSIYIDIWRPLLPQQIKQFVDALLKINISGDLGIPLLNREYGIIQELQMLFQTLRYYLIPFMASCFSFFLLDWKKLKAENFYKSFLYLLISFIVLILIHLIAPISNNVYLYSMPAYPSFFIPIGLLILPFYYQFLRKEKESSMVTILLIFFILIMFTGTGLSLYRMISKPLMEMKVPRIKNFTLQGGKVELWTLLGNKLALDYFQLEYLITATFGLLLGILFILLSITFWKTFLRRKTQFADLSLTKAIFFQFIFVYILLTPTKYVAGNSSINLCTNGDVLESHEKVAEELKKVIPDGSLVYYETSETSIPLLYLTKVDFYPNLLNQQFYFRIGGDEAYLEKNGYWNESLAYQWISKADYLILGEEEAKYWEPKLGNFPVSFDKLLVTDNTIPCRDRTYLHVYKVIK